MTALLNAATLRCLGAVSGIDLSVLVHDHRVCDLSALHYLAMHQMRDKTFKRVMPWVGLGTLGGVMTTPADPRSIRAAVHCQRPSSRP